MPEDDPLKAETCRSVTIVKWCEYYKWAIVGLNVKILISVLGNEQNKGSEKFVITKLNPNRYFGSTAKCLLQKAAKQHGKLHLVPNSLALGCHLASE